MVDPMSFNGLFAGLGNSVGFRQRLQGWLVWLSVSFVVSSAFEIGHCFAGRWPSCWSLSFRLGDAIPGRLGGVNVFRLSYREGKTDCGTIVRCLALTGWKRFVMAWSEERRSQRSAPCIAYAQSEYCLLEWLMERNVDKRGYRVGRFVRAYKHPAVRGQRVHQ